MHIYDELTEIHDYRSFLCDAFASLVTEDNCLDKNTAMGASRFCYLIKQQMRELKGDLKKTQEKENAQKQVARRRGKRNKTSSAQEQTMTVPVLGGPIS
ncbi:MAG: hypothetical protein P8179_22730 [Candidatus Thiodiazotropha sp.]|jgi:hydroxylamine reductase (hybrid-cluster protein)